MSRGLQGPAGLRGRGVTDTVAPEKQILGAWPHVRVFMQHDYNIYFRGNAVLHAWILRAARMRRLSIVLRGYCLSGETCRVQGRLLAAWWRRLCVSVKLRT